eukprot:COSAG01_NODE_1195_length_11304_cov_118.555823_10_plen_45_part_00
MAYGMAASQARQARPSRKKAGQQAGWLAGSQLEAHHDGEGRSTL